MKHLWEIKHAYHCEGQNYFQSGLSTTETIHHFESFKDFMDDWGDSDMDYNLVFRWDWLPKDPEWEREQDELHVFFMMQRKGFHVECIVDGIKRTDEPKVRAFLTKRAEYMKELWEPLL